MISYDVDFDYFNTDNEAGRGFWGLGMRKQMS
jgi:hypothetical protein